MNGRFNSISIFAVQQGRKQRPSPCYSTPPREPSRAAPPAQETNGAATHAPFAHHGLGLRSRLAFRADRTLHAKRRHQPPLPSIIAVRPPAGNARRNRLLRLTHSPLTRIEIRVRPEQRQPGRSSVQKVTNQPARGYPCVCRDSVMPSRSNAFAGTGSGSDATPILRGPMPWR